MLDFQLLVLITQNSAFISFKVFHLLVEVTLEKVYYSKLKFTIVNGTVSVTGIFQFTILDFTLVNFHDYRGKNKDDPSPITIWLPKKINGYISSLSKLCLFC